MKKENKKKTAQIVLETLENYRTEAIMDAYRHGYNSVQIGIIFGKHHSTILRIIKKYNEYE